MTTALITYAALAVTWYLYALGAKHERCWVDFLMLGIFALAWPAIVVVGSAKATARSLNESQP